MYLNRHITDRIHRSLDTAPVTAILGPRQCGKSTLIKHMLSTITTGSQEAPILLDLERPSDLARLTDPETFFNANRHRLVCLDEIQREPDLFPVIRAHVDEVNGSRMFLITGSASPDLLRQGAETLAGRIAFHELTPFSFGEVAATHDLIAYMVRGGFPRSLLADTDQDSFEWRLQFIRTYLERDLGQFGLNIPVPLVRRLWQMLAHLHGQLINYSQLSGSLGVSSPTVKKYTDLLTGTFMIRMLEPYHGNLKKRLVRTPKVYIRDSGILMALLGIRDYNALLGHPVYGTLWESIVIENIIHAFPGVDHTFFRSGHGAEIDLVLFTPQGPVAIECKVSSAPKPTRGFYQACDDIGAQLKLVVAPVDSSWPISEHVEVHNLSSSLERIEKFLGR
ncbi:MAG: ATP-binding protein [Saprospiraceae bacterium]|nr:ATP-binding protein [Saprospiraceae bacterium]